MECIRIAFEFVNDSVNRVKWHASSWTRTADPCAGFLIDCTVCTSHTRAVVASHSRIVVYGGTGGRRRRRASRRIVIIIHCSQLGSQCIPG